MNGRHDAMLAVRQRLGEAMSGRDECINCAVLRAENERMRAVVEAAKKVCELGHLPVSNESALIFGDALFAQLDAFQKLEG